MVTYIFKKKILNKNVLRLGMLVTALAIMIIAFLTFYGNNVGNFVMSIDDELSKRKVCMAASPEEFDGITPNQIEKMDSLAAEPVFDARDITEDWLDIPNACLAHGDFHDEQYKYVAYSFYVKNCGLQNSDIKYEISLTNIKRNVDKAVRIMVITSQTPKEDEIILQKISDMYASSDNKGSEAEKKLKGYLLGKQKIYKAPDDDDIEEELLKNHTYNFLSKNKVCEEKIENFLNNKMMKFTVFLWLDGNDKNCNNSVLGGKVKINMHFSIEKRPLPEKKEV